jgi:hypothetical protein
MNIKVYSLDGNLLVDNVYECSDEIEKLLTYIEIFIFKNQICRCSMVLVDLHNTNTFYKYCCDYNKIKFVDVFGTVDLVEFNIILLNKKKIYDAPYCDKIKKNPIISFELFKEDYSIITNIDDTLRNDYKFMLKCIKYNCIAFYYASHKLKNNYDFLLDCMDIDDGLFDYVIDRINNDYDFAIYAMSKYPELIKYLSFELRDDYKIAYICVKNNKKCIFNISKRLQKHKKIRDLFGMINIY